MKKPIDKSTPDTGLVFICLLCNRVFTISDIMVPLSFCLTTLFLTVNVLGLYNDCRQISNFVSRFKGEMILFLLIYLSKREFLRLNQHLTASTILIA